MREIVCRFSVERMSRGEKPKETDDKSLYKHMSVNETETRVLRMFFERMRETAIFL